MYTCICHSVTDSEIKKAILDGYGTYAKLQEYLGVGSSCGECEFDIKQILTHTITHERIN